MKLVRFIRDGGAVALGIVVDDEVCEVGPDSETLMEKLLTATPEDLDALARRAEHRTPLGEQELTCPLPRPRRVLALAGNFPPGGRSSLPEGATPWFFSKWADDVGGPGDEVPHAALATEVAPEIELAAVIGSSGRNVPIEHATDLVSYYTIVNDFSARALDLDADRRPGKFAPFFDWLHGKWFDGYLTLGPWLVPQGRIDVGDLRIVTKVNDETCVEGRTSQMAFTVAETVAFLSRFMTLKPGDVVCMGAKHPDGPERLVQPGDVVEGEIDQLGVLRNVMGACANGAGGVGA